MTTAKGEARRVGARRASAEQPSPTTNIGDTRRGLFAPGGGHAHRSTETPEMNDLGSPVPSKTRDAVLYHLTMLAPVAAVILVGCALLWLVQP